MGHAASAQETFKIGIVSFLSGQAAESFGIPAVNGAKVLVEAFNKGQAPAHAPHARGHAAVLLQVPRHGVAQGRVRHGQRVWPHHAEQRL
jgi:hypothetical protein